MYLLKFNAFCCAGLSPKKAILIVQRGESAVKILANRILIWNQ